jgi:hypothetical protein
MLHLFKAKSELVVASFDLESSLWFILVEVADVA